MEMELTVMLFVILRKRITTKNRISEGANRKKRRIKKLTMATFPELAFSINNKRVIK